MSGIQDIGNGLGLVYMTAVDGTTIESWCPNNNISIRSFRQNGNVVAPFASKKSAYGTLTFTTGTAAAGSITGVAVNGVDQIPGNILVTGLTDDECAELVAAAVNSFTPGSGYNYTAVAIGPTVYFYAPPIAGATPNGYAIVLSDTGSVVTYTTEAFTGGSDQSGTYDSVGGSRFFLNADYGPGGIPGELPADPESLTNAIEITKFFIVRGQQLGIFSKDIQANNYTISGIDRSGFVTKIFIQPQAGNTQTVVKLAAEDFVDGDIVFLQSLVSTDAITVESAPAVSVPVAGNIYLTNNIAWTNLSSSSIMLQYKYDTTLGPIFVEVSRSLTDILIEKSVFVTPSGDDSTAKKYYLNRPFLTLDAALTAASSGDTIIVYPGSYSAGVQLSKSGVTWNFMDGAIVTGGGFGMFEITDFDVTVLGMGDFVAGGYFVLLNGSTGSFFCSAKNIASSDHSIYCSGTGDVTINSLNKITSASASPVFYNTGSSGNHYIKANEIGSQNSNGLVWSTVSYQNSAVVFDGFNGNAVIDAGKITKVDGMACITVGAISSPGSVIINCPAIINFYTAGVIPAVGLNPNVNYCQINGNIFAYGAGSLVDGIFLNSASLANPINFDFYGNIYTEQGMGMYVTPNSYSFVKIVGELYCKTQNLPAGAVMTTPCAVYVHEGAAGVSIKTTIRIEGSINQFRAASGCIYKGMYTNGGADVDNLMELKNAKLYVSDVTTASIIGEAPVGPATNQVVAIGCIANVADDANITVAGVALSVTTALSSMFPPYYNQ